VDVKINAPELLLEEVRRKRKGRVWVSGVCDPYQPLEENYRLTGKCLEILVRHNWPVIVQTRSPLVLRDLDILREAQDLQTGLSITTADDETRKIFEPNAPPVMDRVRTVDELHRNGIRTYAMIAPILPGADKLPGILEGKVDYIMVDRMNYHYADWVYERHGLNDRRTDSYFRNISSSIAAECERLRMDCRLVY
jgi:DNA repair photolyase